MGFNTLLYLLGAVTLEQPWLMTVLFSLFYIVFGLLSLTRPVAAVVMYFGTVIMNPQNSYPVFMDLPVAKVMAIWCILISMLNFGKLRFRFHFIIFLVLVFIFTANMSDLYSLSPLLSDKRTEEFNKSFIMLFITVLVVNNRKDYEFLFWGLTGSFFYNILKNIIQTQTKGQWVVVTGTAGWLGDSNDWALALAMALPLFYRALAVKWNNGWLARLSYSLATAGALLTLTMTSSRGGFLAAAIPGVVFLAMDRKPGKAALVSFALACVVAVYMPGTFLRKIESLAGMSDKVTTSWNNGADEDQEYTGAERVYYWKVAKQIMEEHPLTGIGWGNFADEFARREGLSEGIVAHSTWFQVGAEAGMTGLAAFSAMIAGAIGYSFMSWRRFRRTGDTWGEMHSRVLLTGLLAYCVGGTFISREYSELLFLYIAMTAVIAEQSLQEAATSPATSPALNRLVSNPQ